MSVSFSRFLRVCLLIIVFASSSAAGPGIMAGVSDAGADATIALVLRDINEKKLDAALARTENLLKLYPNFRLAHLIRGDLLMARGAPLRAFGNAADSSDTRIADLRDEAIARLKGYSSRPAQAVVPRYLLEMPEDQKYAVVVDTQRSRLYLYRNDKGRPSFVADYYITQGKEGAEKTREGDKRTPIGVYRVTSRLSREKLGDFYGAGAFPISYPNEWDRINGRNGHGIWLHGVPSNTYSRPPKASDGCVVLTNEDFTTISEFLQVGVTPVIISSSVEWASIDDWQADRKALNAQLDAWRHDWESGDVDKYLTHYSRDFRSNEGAYAAWAVQKRRVAATKTWVQVKTERVSMLRYPGKQEMVVVTFQQDYRSNNLSNVTQKRQYWVRESGQWKIIYEGTA